MSIKYVWPRSISSLTRLYSYQAFSQRLCLHAEVIVNRLIASVTHKCMCLARLLKKVYKCLPLIDLISKVISVIILKGRTMASKVHCFYQPSVCCYNLVLHCLGVFREY